MSGSEKLRSVFLTMEDTQLAEKYQEWDRGFGSFKAAPDPVVPAAMLYAPFLLSAFVPLWLTLSVAICHA